MKELLKHTWTHLRRSPYQAIGAITIMFLTFFITSVVIMLGAGFHQVLRYFETKPQITAFFSDKATQEQIQALSGQLLSSNKVKEVKFVSKEEALNIYKEQNKNDPLLLQMVTANILPASLEVSPKDITNLPEVAQIIRAEPVIEEVVFQEDVVKALQSWTTTIRQFGLGICSFLFLVSFLIVLIIIGIKIALRKDEIEILRLIGASNWYIRWPFLFEGMFYGLSGAFLGWSTTYLLLLYATPYILTFFSGIPLLPVPIIPMLILLGLELSCGLVIGFIGSLLALRRYLR